jgi:formyltetrahydrofolate-dependent phosphoribosylglycinamide formyltransferase
VNIRKKTVILISGRGSNMAALIEAASELGFPAEIAGVISDQPDAPGLIIANQQKVPAHVIRRADFASKEAHDAAIDVALQALGAEIVALAGYMRLLTPGFVRKWQGRMINIPPALLPAFRGLDTHRRAIEAGVRLSGCTVHFVTSEVDSGPIIAQAAVPVLSSDTEGSLAARVLRAEHQLYPLALRLVADGRVRMGGSRAVFDLGDGSERVSGPLVAPDLYPAAPNLEDLARFTP